ncbi:MAG: hypothetical protein Tp172DCM1112201_59 [Prokaryotic dsDNA virus sp.]|nr:MAG: hypothetical protein Tp172DCM1112201_59 [Prokaryotic dsDNA virus sp.]
MTTTVNAITTLLWILIEAIQFGYMAYLMWRERNVNGRHTVRARSAFASA